MGRVRLHFWPLHAASIVLDQVVDRLHPALFGLSRVNSPSRLLFLGRLFVEQFRLEVADKDQVVVIFLVVLTIVLFVLPPGAFGCLGPLGLVHFGVYIVGGLPELAFGLGECDDFYFAPFLIAEGLVSTLRSSFTSSCRPTLRVFPCQSQ